MTPDLPPSPAHPRGIGSLKRVSMVSKRDRTWRWRLITTTPTGRKWKTFIGTDAAAVEELAEWHKSLQGKRTASARTVVDLCDAMMESSELLAKSTRDSYERYLNKWIRATSVLVNDKPVKLRLGKMTASSVKAKHVEDLFEIMRATGCAPGTERQVRAILGKAFTLAVADELISSNPVRLSKTAATKPTRIVLPTAEEIRDALAAAGRRGLPAQLGLRLAAVLGARRAEVVALRWEHVDLERGTVAIVAALEQDGKRRKDTKTGMERVGLTVDAETVELLRRVQYAQDSDGQWVVSLDRGLTPCTPDWLSHQWQCVRPRPDLPLKNLRHHSISTLIAAGMSLPDVQRRVGHKPGSAVTLASYARSTAPDDRHLTDVMARVLNG